MSDKAMDVALWRYSLIREPAERSLSKAERGRMVRRLAETTHTGPNGEPVEVSRQSIDRWIRAWRAGGFEALRPRPRQVLPRTPPELLELACSLRREDRCRTAAHIAELITAAYGYSPSSRTLQRHLAAAGLRRVSLTGDAVAHGRFEASAPNELWVGDALHGPKVEGRSAILFCYLDDHSRLATGYRFVHHEDTRRAEEALRRAVTSRGLPKVVYLDNGSPFIDRQLLRALAVLGVRLVHSRPGRPEGRGKIERYFRTVREQFLVEVPHSSTSTLAQLNDRFEAWVESTYHHRVHSETGATPLERFLADGPPPLPDLALVREAFLWSERRLVTKSATVSLHSNTYEVDPALCGRSVELVFDAFDLSRIEVRYQGRHMGLAVPQVIGRHSHPKARPEPAAPVAPSGIDYLALVEARHRASAEAAISFADLGAASSDNNSKQAGR